ncbi:MAG: endonuclease/exonuclease/phosphatase family protein [Planctomycetes bacterium]|nr:endonuclease/exonuclease/phosphatase family protein [Planctomycetota bacterium]
MKPNYTVLTVLCLLLCVPLIVVLMHRRSATAAVPVVRFATFNVALNRPAAGDLLTELRSGQSVQAKAIAEVVQRVQPDVLLLCELDRDVAAEAAQVFARQYLAVSQKGELGIDFTFSYAGPVNTGEPSGLDLDGDGRSDGPGDAFGYGAFPGQYGMVLLSRHAIVDDQVRTFRQLRWSAMPGALRPPGCRDEAWAALRLSSKSHWDVPLRIGPHHEVVHVLCSHPTPPVFDGPEDRNGCRNHDEIRFWVDYLTPAASGWIVDDAGIAGGLAAAASFVLMGDLNCDPVDGDARRDALLALLAHPRVQDPQPRSEGGVAAQQGQWGVNADQRGDPALDTGDFPDVPGQGPGNLRTDYVLVDRARRVARSGVFWPPQHEPGAAAAEASDHRLVFVDVEVR